MQFCENILKHLMLQQEMGKAHVPDSLLKDYEEEELLELSQNINEMDAGSLLAAGNIQEAVEYLVRDQGFLPCLVLLSQAESYDAGRASSLLIGAKERLSESYAYDQIASVVSDSRIEADRTYIYLKYFISEHFYAFIILSGMLS